MPTHDENALQPWSSCRASPLTQKGISMSTGLHLHTQKTLPSTGTAAASGVIFFGVERGLCQQCMCDPSCDPSSCSRAGSGQRGCSRALHVPVSLHCGWECATWVASACPLHVYPAWGHGLLQLVTVVLCGRGHCGSAGTHRELKWAAAGGRHRTSWVRWQAPRRPCATGRPAGQQCGHKGAANRQSAKGRTFGQQGTGWMRREVERAQADAQVLSCDREWGQSSTL